MRIRKTKEYIVKNYGSSKDKYGNTIDEYNDGFTIRSYIYPLSGSIYLQQYGNELQYQYRMLTDADFVPILKNGKLIYIDKYNNSIAEGDGVCVFNNKEVDFKIKSIMKHKHLVIELEMIH